VLVGIDLGRLPGVPHVPRHRLGAHELGHRQSATAELPHHAPEAAVGDALHRRQCRGRIDDLLAYPDR